jgi:hypothetical protein
MTITIVFLGQGEARPSEADVAAIEALANELLQEANQ